MIDFGGMFDSLEIDGFWCFLKQTKPIEQHEPDIQDMLRLLYGNSEQQVVQRMGTLMNAIFTQKIQTFMLSRRSLVPIFAEDELSNYKNIGTKDYNLLLYKLTNSPLFTVLRKPTRNKAGVYQLVEPQLLDILAKSVGRDFLKKQEQYVLHYYDKTAKTADVDKQSGETDLDRKERLKAKIRKDLLRG